MNLTAWVDVGIGMSVVYLGASLFVTIVNEYIVQLSNMRGRNLAKSLQKLIGSDEIKTKLQAIPALTNLLNGQNGKAPSYVDPLVFAQALLGTLMLDETIVDERKRWTAAIEKVMPADTSFRQQLLGVVNGASDRAEGLSKGVSEWLDRSLTMLGESYKRCIQLISLLIGLLIAGFFNIDTIDLTAHLYQDKEAREAAALVGEQLAQTTSKEQFNKCLALGAAARKDDPQCKSVLGVVDAVQKRNGSLGKLPIGWDGISFTWNCAGLLKVLGWILTALALSLGAPFWFDFLNRFVSVRHGMAKPQPEKSR